MPQWYCNFREGRWSRNLHSSFLRLNVLKQKPPTIVGKIVLKKNRKNVKQKNLNYLSYDLFSWRQFCCMMSGWQQQDEDNCWYTEQLVQSCVEKCWEGQMKFICTLYCAFKLHPEISSKGKMWQAFFFLFFRDLCISAIFNICDSAARPLWANQSRRWMLHYGPISFSLAERLIKWFGLLLAEGGWRLLSAFAAEGITAS